MAWAPVAVGAAASLASTAMAAKSASDKAARADELSKQMIENARANSQKAMATVNQATKNVSQPSAISQGADARLLMMQQQNQAGQPTYGTQGRLQQGLNYSIPSSNRAAATQGGYSDWQVQQQLKNSILARDVAQYPVRSAISQLPLQLELSQVNNPSGLDTASQALGWLGSAGTALGAYKLGSKTPTLSTSGFTPYDELVRSKTPGFSSFATSADLH